MPISVFGAGAVQTAYVSYLAIDLSAGSVVLVWPTSYVDVPYTDTSTGINYNTLAASMTITTVNPNTSTITLPNAQEGSVAGNFIIYNIGNDSFTIYLNDGTTQLVTITTGQIYWIQLTDNSTTNGTWQLVHFGTGTSTADATILEGYGLTALGITLNTDIPIQKKSADYTVATSDRASLIVWQGGSGTITLPAVGDNPAGFYISINNEGTGDLTIVPTGVDVTIDNVTTFQVQGSQSLSIISDGTNWWTLGFGQSTFATVTVLELDVSGSSNIELSPIQASYTIQEYSGTLTGNIIIFFPDSTNYWFISNTTDGDFTLSVRLGTASAPLGTLYTIGQGDRQIFYSDGSSLYDVPTTLASILFSDGTAATPSITFADDTSTGLYRDTTPFLGISVSGTQIAKATSTGFALAPGKTLVIPDSTSVATTTASTNVNYSSWAWGGASAATAQLQLTGTSVTSTATLISGLTGLNLSFTANAATGSINYNSVSALVISNTGVVTFPQATTFSGAVTLSSGLASALPIGSGGTGQTTATAALSALMPATPATGTMVYYNGTNWVNLPIGTNGQFLTVVGGIPAWTT